LALTVIAATVATGTQRGIELDEPGMVCRRFSVRYFCEVNDRLPGISGETVARATAALFSIEITIEGETTGSTTLGIFGIILGGSNIVVGTTIKNDIAWKATAFAGKIFFDEVTETQDRTGWRSVNGRLSGNSLL
jgi:hypothetical protein